MMIYAGQELGERASDAEGFSGCDGRTTIFDYWSIPTLRRRMAKGYPSDSGLPESMVKLRDIYSRVLNMARTEPAFVHGEFFDLMYVNYTSTGMNPHRHYLYLRHYAHTTILVAVNFADTDADIAVNIPQHAFDYLAITPGMHDAEELFNAPGTIEQRELADATPFDVHIPAHGAAIWRLTPHTGEPEAASEKISEKKRASKPTKKGKKD